MAAFIPGESPPEVNTAIFFIDDQAFVKQWPEEGRLAKLAI
jgi:hypothetical protein